MTHDSKESSDFDEAGFDASDPWFYNKVLKG